MGAENIGSLSFNLGMGYDPAGLKLFKDDLKDTQRAAADMAKAMSGIDINMMGGIGRNLGGVGRNVDSVAKAMAESLKKQKAEFDLPSQSMKDHLDFVSTQKSDREMWLAKSKERDADIADSARSARLAIIQNENANRQMQKSDREYWLERARMRDQDIRDQIQSDKIAATAAASPSRFKNLGNTTADNNRNNSGFQGAMIAQQLGFGIQDFMSQVTNSKNMVDGLGRGIMAVSNNVQMLGQAWGPTGLAVTAIGGALAGIVVPTALKWLYNTEEEEKQTKKIADNIERIGDRLRDVASIKFGSVEDIMSQNDNLQKQSLIKEQQAKQEQSLIDVRKKQIETIKEEQKADFAKTMAEKPGQTIEERNAAIAAMEERNKGRRSDIKDIEKDIDPISKRVNDLTKESQDFRIKAEQTANASIIAERRKLEIDAAKALGRDSTGEQKIAMQQRLESTQRTIDTEIEAYKKRYEGETEADRKAADFHISQLERRKQANAEMLAAIKQDADKAANEELRQERLRDVKERVKAAEENAKSMAIAGIEQGGGKLNFADPEMRKQERQLEIDRMTERFQRERKEQKEKNKELDPEAKKAAMDMLSMKQWREAQASAIANKEDEISRLSPMNKSAAGVNIASSEGISAINRAVAGTRTEQDVQKQQLEAMKATALNTEKMLQEAGKNLLVTLGF